MKTKQVFCLGGKDTMKKSVVLLCSSLTVLLSCAFSQAATIQGTVVNEKNMPVEGVMVSAIDNDGALMDFDYEDVQVSKAIFNHCRKLILVADNFKFDSTAPMLIGNISEVDILVTNFQPPSEIIKICNTNNIEIVVASKPDQEES